MMLSVLAEAVKSIIRCAPVTPAMVPTEKGMVTHPLLENGCAMLHHVGVYVGYQIHELVHLFVLQLNLVLGAC